jgi:hypothetical protein
VRDSAEEVLGLQIVDFRLKKSKTNAEVRSQNAEGRKAISDCRFQKAELMALCTDGLNSAF